MEPLAYTLEDLRGVGRVELELRPNQRAYVFFGSNGVGKTKCLEGLFQYWFFTRKGFDSISFDTKNIIFAIGKSLVAGVYKYKSYQIKVESSIEDEIRFFITENNESKLECNFPVVFLGAGKRGHIEEKIVNSELLGNFKERKKRYFERIEKSMLDNFSSLGMDMGLEQWIVTIAHAANPFQVQEDNRRIEIDILLQLLHKVDSRFDPTFLTIDGNNNVSIKVNGIITKIRDLSTGFASLLKIFQAIISGYGFFTNETDLANVKGVVFIDEIESHLHVEWQSKIIPLLKELFPNTTFYIATHSPIILSQLEEGEAYRLEKQADGVVRATIIEAPNRKTIFDVLNDGLNLNLNTSKIQRTTPESQSEAKRRMLELLEQDNEVAQ